MQFEMMRIALVQRQQADAFERRTASGSPFTREAWLREIFGEAITFTHRNDTFHFSPEKARGEPSAIVGRIGREITISENEPPDKHLAPKEEKIWRASTILIDPTHHDDGQKVAFEFLSQVGKPVPILQSLATHINKGNEPFVLEVNAIVPSETFWNFVNANQGEITVVQFEFVAPNMFGEADDYDAEVREMQKNEKIQKAKLRLESKDGLNLNTKRVQRAADYTIKGAGSIEARTKRGKRYDSREKAQRVSIPNKEITSESSVGLMTRLFKRILRT